jgi:hypothetical protein
MYVACIVIARLMNDILHAQPNTIYVGKTVEVVMQPLAPEDNVCSGKRFTTGKPKQVEVSQRNR